MIRCEPLAQGVAEGIAGENGENGSQSGEQGQPPFALDDPGAVAKNRPPARLWRLDTEAEIAEACFQGDRPGDTEAGVDHQRRQQVGQEVTFHGDKGLLKVANGPFNANLFAEARIELHNGQTVTSERWPAANHYKLQVENFGRTIRTGAAYPCPLEFTRGTPGKMAPTLQVMGRKGLWPGIEIVPRTDGGVKMPSLRQTMARTLLSTIGG